MRSLFVSLVHANADAECVRSAMTVRHRLARIGTGLEYFAKASSDKRVTMGGVEYG